MVQRRHATAVIFLVAVFFAQCNSNKTVADTPTKTENKQVNKSFISGIVREIQRGKDGYTAKITTAGNMAYYATVSHSNLKDPAQYKTAKAGDTLQVLGEMWKMEKENHITVREMK